MRRDALIINSHLVMKSPGYVSQLFFLSTWTIKPTTHFVFSFQLLAGLSHLRVPCLRVRYVLLKPLYPKNCGVNVFWKDVFVSRQLLMLHSTIKPNYKTTHALLSVALPLSDWLFLVSLAGGAWAGAAWVFAFVSPMTARTSDTYKRITAYCYISKSFNFTPCNDWLWSLWQTGFEQQWRNVNQKSMEQEMPYRNILHSMFMIREKPKFTYRNNVLAFRLFLVTQIANIILKSRQ